MINTICSMGIFVSLILYMFNIINHVTYCYMAIPFMVVGVIAYIIKGEI